MRVKLTGFIVSVLIIYYYNNCIHPQGATLDPITMVHCRSDLSCGGSSINSTMKDCCDHDIDPSGFSYTIPGVEGCQLCPVGKRKL